MDETNQQDLTFLEPVKKFKEIFLAGFFLPLLFKN